MPTQPKTDPVSLRRRVLRVIAKEVKAIEDVQRKAKGAPLDAKFAASLQQYLKQLDAILKDDELRFTKLMTDAAKMPAEELRKLVGQAPAETEEEEDEDGDALVDDGPLPDAEG